MNFHRRSSVSAFATLFTASIAASFLGCGAGEAARPKDPTFAGATGGATIQSGASCHDVGKEGSPLVVDWKPEDRGDLEEAMKKGIAVVHYDCNSFKLLADCNPTGTYGFVGITTKEEVISLKNADEAKANLPLNGGTLGASLATGSEIDVALMMIGKRSATNSDLSRDAMTGKCDGATHFVRAATIGAFSMQTATSGNAQAAGTMLGIGASGASSSDKSALNKDGDPAACKGVDVDAEKPPGQCAALIRVQLVGISDNGTGSAAAVASASPDTSKPAGKSKATDNPVTPPPSDLTCPADLVAVAGKCTAPVANTAHECKYGDPTDCDAQCTLGDLTSCARLGFMYTDMTGFVHYDEKKSLALFTKACDGGNQAGCTGLGEAYSLGDVGVAEDDGKAAGLFKTACAAGYADACDDLGDMFERGAGVPKDQLQGLKLHVRACNAASTNACITMGEFFEKGKGGVKKDLPTAMAFYDRSCAGGSKETCDDLGDRYTSGDGAPAADKAKGVAYYTRGCGLGYSASCTSLGDAYAKGDGVTADPAKSQAMYTRACTLNAKSASCKKAH